MADSDDKSSAASGVNGDRAARFRLLYDLACAFAARIEIDELIPLVVQKCREVLRAEGAAVLLLHPEHEELYFPYVAEDDPEVAARLIGLRFPADQGIAGSVVKSGRSVRVDDAQSDPRFYSGVDRKSGLTTRAILAVPLASRQGTIGVIEVVNHRDGARFSDDDLAFLEVLAGSVAVTIENARLYAQVKASEERLRAQVGALRRDLARRDQFSEIVGSSPAMQEIFRLMQSASASPIAVLIQGETGTGKEPVARGIHNASSRGEEPFIAVNCAAVSETLLESELFGHRRGAFTGATHDQRGLFEAASGGTIFMDEVGEMPATMQAKLLRVLQEGEIVPVGETRPRKVDVRVVSATNRDLRSEVAGRRFREDLFYRLAAFPIHLPALRQRREDIPLLVDHILAGAAQRHQKRIPGIEPAALQAIVRFDWPGNVRQLQNEIERAVALAQDGEAITLAHLSLNLEGADVLASSGPADLPIVAEGAPRPDDTLGSIRSARAAFEARFITEALRQCGGNVSRAAKAVGMSRPMLHRKMKTYGISA